MYPSVTKEQQDKLNEMKKKRKERRKKKITSGWLKDLCRMYGLLLCMRRIVVCSHSDRLWWSWQQQQQFAIIFEELKWHRIPCCTNNNNNVYMWFFFFPISTSYFFNGIRVYTRKWMSSKHMQTLLIWIKMIKMSKHDSMHMHVCNETYGEIENKWNVELMRPIR